MKNKFLASFNLFILLITISCHVRQDDSLSKLEIEVAPRKFIKVKHDFWEDSIFVNHNINIKEPIFSIDSLNKILYLFDCYNKLLKVDIQNGKTLKNLVLSSIDKDAQDYELALLEDYLIFRSNNHFWLLTKDFYLSGSYWDSTMVKYSERFDEIEGYQYSIKGDSLIFKVNYLEYPDIPLASDSIPKYTKRKYFEDKYKLPTSD